MSIATGAGSLASYTYLANNGKIDTMTYANGKAIKYFYDDLDRVEIAENSRTTLIARMRSFFIVRNSFLFFRCFIQNNKYQLIIAECAAKIKMF